MNSFISFITHPYYGSNRVSRLLRRKIEGKSPSELFGIPLAIVVFLATVMVPQSRAAFDTTSVYFDTQDTSVSADVTPHRYRWPMPTFGISTYFSPGHPGIDLTDPAGTPIYPMADGKVILAETLFSGYGRHVMIEHTDGMVTNYAHLSKSLVSAGQQVTKETPIGEVGATGWATGNHLHFEIYLHGVPQNPLEILPEAKVNQSRAISQSVLPGAPPDLSL